MAKVCQNCGGTSFIATTKGTMCKACKEIVQTDAPVNKSEDSKPTS